MKKVFSYGSKALVDLLPWPATDAHKYSRGKAVLVAGSAAYPGAACLAACACERMGAGYTQVLCAPESVSQVRLSSNSLVVSVWDSVGADEPHLPDAQAYLVGSGFEAADAKTAQMVLNVLSLAQAPVVVDGGGLAVLSTPAGREALKIRFEEGFLTLLTPHAGEAKRLAEPFGFAPEVFEDAALLSYKLSLALGAVVAVKGPVTYISDGNQTVCMRKGTPALAKAGTGDVLAGMIVALLAQGLKGLYACALATNLHAMAGQAAAKQLSEICVCAQDVIYFLPDAIKALTKAASRD